MLASSAAASQLWENRTVRVEPRTVKEKAVGNSTIRERARQSNITLTTALSLS
jgi:hypothetical protein